MVIKTFPGTLHRQPEINIEVLKLQFGKKIYESVIEPGQQVVLVPHSSRAHSMTMAI